MTYAEVVRLRRLRNAALRTRALATALDEFEERRNSVFFRSAASCWRVARVISGTLRHHPFVPFQQDPGAVRAAYQRFTANALVARARRQNRTFELFSGELQRVAHELDDVRALTRSVELSEAFGRAQQQLRRLMQEVESGECQLNSSQQDGAPRVDVSAAALDNGAGRGNWPYIAF